MLALRLAGFEHLVDIGRVDELRGIERRNGAVSDRRGDHARPTVERDAGGRRGACRCSPGPPPLIGHFQIRNRGTIGGSLAHADPAAEYPAVALALDAEFEALSARGGGARSRRREFFTACGPPRWTPTSCSPASVPGRGPGACGLRGRGVRPPPRRLRHRRRRRSRSSSTTAIASRRCAIALFGLGSTPRAGHRRPRPRVDGAAVDDVDRRRGRAGGGRRTSTRSRRPARLGRPTGRRVGAAMVARAWTACRRGGRAMHDTEVDGHGQRCAPHGRPSSRG